MTRGMASAACARQARDRSWWTKPWVRNRASRRCATRCSRCRWTVSSVSRPASAKTTGRMGASRRHSASGWPRRRGARSESSVAVQVRSPAALRSSGGKVQTGAPRASRVSRSGGAPDSSSAHESASRNGAGSNAAQRRERSSRVRQRSICAARSACRSRADSSSVSTARRRRASRSARSMSRASRSASPRRMPPRRRRSTASSITRDRLPSSRRIVFVLSTNTLSTLSSARCGSTK